MKYIIFPQAQTQLEKSGLNARINEYFNKTDSLSICGMLYADEVKSSLKELQNEGHFEHFPQLLRNKFDKEVSRLLNNDKNATWQIENKDYNTTDLRLSNLEAIMLFSGFYTSYILKPHEVWDYEKFGFKNPFDLVGCIGAAMLDRDTIHETYPYTSEYPDGKTILTQLERTCAVDLYVGQTNITQYETICPFNTNVSFRPIRDEDRTGIGFGQGGEIAFLACLLKYHKQMRIESQFLNNIDAFYDELSPKALFSGITKEHLNPISDIEYKPLFLNFDSIDIPTNKKEWSSYYIKNSNAYIIDGELRFYAHNAKDPQSRRMLRIQPNDFDNILKSLFFQVAKGGTGIKEPHLRTIVDYYLKDDFNN